MAKRTDKPNLEPSSKAQLQTESPSKVDQAEIAVECHAEGTDPKAKRPEAPLSKPAEPPPSQTEPRSLEGDGTVSERHGFLARIDRKFRIEFINYAFSFCKDYDKAGDLVQDAYRRFLESGWCAQAAKTDPLAGARSYIRLTIRRLFIDGQRAKNRHSQVHNDMQHRQRATAGLSLHGDVLEAYEALHSLPSDLCEIFVLHYVFGYQQNEIAEILGLSPSTISRRLNRAVATLEQDWLVKKK